MLFFLTFVTLNEELVWYEIHNVDNKYVAGIGAFSLCAAKSLF